MTIYANILRFIVALLILSLSIQVLGKQDTMHKKTQQTTQQTTIFVAGDSTAASYDDTQQQGWGGVIAQYFDTTKLNIQNHARAGSSTRSFIREGNWEKLIAEVKPGDLVLIQMGHNDASPINDETRARGTLPGLSDDFVDIDNLLTKKQERVYSFGHYLKKMVNDIQQKDAKPILLSLTSRNVWHGDRIERGFGQYGFWAYQVALELDIPFIDVTNAMADYLESIGQSKAASLFPKDHTHFNVEGAKAHAEQIVAALKGMKPTLKESFYSAKGKAVTAYPWTFVRLPFVADPKLRSIFLVGDSTVRNGRGDGDGGQWGWGDFVSKHFSSAQYNIVNRAVGGLSSRTFVTGGHWQRALNLMSPGDVVLLQFGHNDASALNDNSRARGTIKGISNEYVDINNILTGKAERVHSYGWYLRKMIGEAMARGITPIICSPVPRKIWNEDKTLIALSENSYALWSETIARQSGVLFIDLHTLVANEYNYLGPVAVEDMFADERTHTSKQGAILTGSIVAKKLTQILGTRK